MIRNRREIIGALAASGAVLASTRGAQSNPVALDLNKLKKETDFACLYHCDFGDPQRFSQLLQNMLNHYSAYDFDSFKLKLVVVAHGAGLKFFLEDLSGTPWEKETIDQITYKRLNIDPSKTRKDAFLKFVPSGVATVAELQAKGFGYLKVG